MDTPVTLLDLESLCLEDSTLHSDVRCRVCDSGLEYWPDRIDPMNSFWKCKYSAHSWRNCSGKYSRTYVERLRESDLNHLFYILLPIPTQTIWKMDIEYHKGDTAYHYLREATTSEVLEEAEKRLREKRKKVAAAIGKR